MLVFALIKLGLQSFHVAVTASIGSVAVSFLYPVIYNLASSCGTLSGIKLSLISILTISAAVSLVLIFIISIIASRIIPDNIFEMLFSRFRVPVKAAAVAAGAEVAVVSEPARAEYNYMEDIFTKNVINVHNETEASEDNEIESENMSEKAVDSDRNTDKMGIEMADSSLEPITVNSSLEDCLNEAFRLKESGDPEGAIQYYMYALDKKPASDLVFWIVLDICILYRELNQVEFAREILTAYTEKYSNLMSAAVRKEIESNLSGGL
jgi:hypothetical protein